ncbi:hypothetical protein Trydic_g4494 [Trypoxylus dichotomus]
MWPDKYLTIESKVKVYKTVVRPIITYATEIRADTNRMKRQMRTTKMNTLGVVARRTRRNRVRNETIREKCGIEDVHLLDDEEGNRMNMLK